MQRTILHVDGDAFYVSVERVFDPQLRGKPVIVGGSPRGRHAVLSVSYEARQRGVRTGMPVAQARRLCPEAVWVKGDAGRYATAAQMFMRILEQYSPGVESRSMGQSYVDMTGCQRLQGHPLSVARRIQQQMLESMELSVSIGIGATKLAARLASGVVKPRGILYILPGEEASFLAPMPVYTLPGLNAKTERQLFQLGIRSLGDLGRLEPEFLRSILGNRSEEIRCQALGLDRITVDSKLENYIHQETAFDSEVIDVEVLNQALCELVAKGCRKCRQLKLKTCKVAVQILYTDLQRAVRSQVLKPGTDLDLVVLSAAQEVLKRLHTRRAAVRVLSATLSDLSRERERCLPFDSEEVPARRRFYEGLDAVRDRFGFDSLESGGVFASRRLSVVSGSGRGKEPPAASLNTHESSR